MTWRWVLRFALAVAFVALAGFAAACGGDGDDAGDGGGDGGMEAPYVQVDDRCDEWHPRRLAWSDPVAGSALVACRSLDEGEISLRNVSAKVLHVWSPSGGSVSVDPPGDDPVAVAVAYTVPLGLADGTAYLPPGGTGTVIGSAPVSASFEPDRDLSIRANFSRSVAAWGEGLLPVRPGERLLRGIGNCAQAADTFISEQAYLEDVIRNAFSLPACASVSREILLEAGVIDPPPAGSYDEIIKVGKSAFRPAFVDVVVETAVRLRLP